MALEAQGENANGFHEKAPDYAEGIGFAEQVDVATGADDRKDLKDRDEVDDAGAGTEFAMGLAEPLEQYAIFGDAIENAVSTDDRRVNSSA